MEGYNCIIHIFPNHSEMSEYAAKKLIQLLKDNPLAVVGTATGGTPEDAYRFWGASRADASSVTLIQMDQYIPNGLPPTEDTDYEIFVTEKIANRFPEGKRPKKENIHVPNGRVTNQDDLARELDEKKNGEYTIVGSEIRINHNPIGELGKIHREIERFKKILAENPRDIQVLGMGPGRYPHFGFCDYTTESNAETHLVKLYTDTILANCRYFNGNPILVPKYALTQGPKEVMSSKELLMFVSGEKKAEAVRSTFLSGLSEQELSEASARHIRKHPDLAVAMDRPAAEYIMRNLDDIKRDYESRKLGIKIEIW